MLKKSKIFLVALLAPVFLHAQAPSPTKWKANWQNLDLKTDSVFGISTEKAYKKLLKGKRSTTVVVAVIDNGVDINHEDLKDVIWTNPKEIAGNKVDDDKNGYADDIHGWDFIGGPKGDVHFDNMEYTRLVRKYAPRFDNVDTTKLSATDLAIYHDYLLAKKKLTANTAYARQNLDGINGFLNVLNDVAQKIGNPDPSLTDVRKFEPDNQADAYIKKALIDNWGHYKDLNDFKKGEITPALDHFNEDLNYHYNLDFDPRPLLVGDNYDDASDRLYGNADVTGPSGDHGSHVAGIIGAMRDNNIGIKGIADNVRIMPVRVVPNGDERDKDVANAIRYAADNGARVVNMSFGKSFKYDKKAVDDAVRYAISKDVLLIHAAGNDNADNDEVPNFPTPQYLDNTRATAWIEVGASGPLNDTTLKASFSNYGHSVDVFAPGVDIYSTIPGSRYAEYSGTSMAAPVVTGLAALIRSYYPKLTALQVKEIILKSVAKVENMVPVQGKGGTRQVPFTELCSSGGIVNAYNALKLAAKY